MRTTVALSASLALGFSACIFFDDDPECRADEDCAAPDICRFEECVEPECEASEDCSAGACVDRFCMACATHDQCGVDQVCSEGDCFDRECDVQGDCDEGLGCRDGRCLPCVFDGDCGSSSDVACHHGECVDRECTAEAGCVDDLVCDEGLCLPCGPTLACPDAEGCVDGRCVPCTTDADCGGARTCLEGACFSTCDAASDCGLDNFLGCHHRGQRIRCGEAFCAAERQTGFPQTSVCDPCLESSGGCPSGSCNERRQCECASHDECPTHLACNGGICQGCTEDAHCGCDRYCAAGECHARCDADSDCVGGDRCLVSTGRCVPCLTDSDCGGGRCYEDGCQGTCGGLLSCAPFVPCADNQRCGFCGECGVGPIADPIGACP